jgi:hypothetical protein
MQADFIGLRWRRRGSLGQTACRLSMRGCRLIHRDERLGIIRGRGRDCGKKAVEERGGEWIGLASIQGDGKGVV